ncbi:MAG: 1,4-alpha-glucan branching enzyme [Solirubrobacteraceae bacterium]|nr:1,4-alpha-glucan branching enzyme [Solirubrobacteraceae bacterium]
MTSTRPSERPGVGSTPYAGGVTFRVWAPNAAGASVVRPAEPVEPTAPLGAEPGGWWSADVDGAGVGDQYHYVLTLAGGPVRRLDPQAPHVVNSVGEAIVYDHAAFAWSDVGYVMPGWTELVVYEMHVGSFNPPPTGGVGTFAEAEAKLPYLHDLGINAVELMPVGEFAGDSSWGYNPGLPFAVESAYGGPDALKAFVAAAHALGMAVVLDVVYNHLGPSDNDLWAFDGSLDGAPGGIYFYGPPRGRTPFGDTRPDYGRSEVRDYLRENAQAWLEHFRLDGLRFDATGYVRNIDGGNDSAGDIPDGWRLLQEINDDVDARQPWKLTVAEDMQDNDWVTRPTGGGGAGFDAQWDPDFVRLLREVLARPDDRARSMDVVAGLILRRYSDRTFARVVYTESHDADANGGTRVPKQIDSDHPDSYWAKKRSTLGAAIVLTAPGIPMLFQGQEFLESWWFSDDHPLDWSKTETHPGILALYRDLIRLRRDWFDTTRGLRGAGVDVHHVNDADKVVAFHRWDAGGPRDDVVVLANFADRAYDGYVIGVPRPGTWRVRFNGDWPGYDATFGGQASFDAQTRHGPADGLPWSIGVGLGPYAAVILSQDD